MGLPLLKERRLSRRRRLTGLLPGRLVLSETNKQIVCRPVDVSRDGLGVLSSEKLQPETKVQLILKDRTIMLMIAWVKNDFGKHDLHRYGLVTLDPGDDLERLFEVSGCFYSD